MPEDSASTCWANGASSPAQQARTMIITIKSIDFIKQAVPFLECDAYPARGCESGILELPGHLESLICNII